MATAICLPAGRSPALRSFSYKSRIDIATPLASQNRYELNIPQKSNRMQSIFIQHKKLKCPTTNKNVQRLVPFARSSASDFPVLSLSHTIKQFYASVNKRNINDIAELISEDCCFEDYSFPYSFQGKQDIVSFFNQLTEAMGENVQFRIRQVNEGDELTAFVNWHLEWKENQIPFTRGCTFFQCSTEGAKFRIKAAQVVIESPIKPGKIALATLKILTSLFDEFPSAAEWFFKTQMTILHALTSIYSLFLGSFINPILGCYANLWAFIAQGLVYAISILHFIAKLLK
ncbi:hypothetical protein Droror1_Dr00025343 [Drosera rotundifolia]